MGGSYRQALKDYAIERRSLRADYRRAAQSGDASGLASISARFREIHAHAQYLMAVAAKLRASGRAVA